MSATRVEYIGFWLLAANPTSTENNRLNLNRPAACYKVGRFIDCGSALLYTMVHSLMVSLALGVGGCSRLFMVHLSLHGVRQ